MESPQNIGLPCRCYARRCVHYIGPLATGGADRNQRPICSAFPEGIPEEIAFGKDDHLEPVDGDNGIVYQRDQRSKYSPRGAAEWLAEAIGMTK